MNIRTKIFIGLIAIGIQTTNAQTFGLEYDAELQADFKNRYNLLHYLRLDAELPIASEKLSFEAATLSLYQSRGSQLVPDLQTYSNIEADNMPLTLPVACLKWQIDERNTLYAGIRAMDEDYFASDGIGFFTNSSCGIFPTLSMNHPINIFPVSSVGIHYKYTRDNVELQASLYNGQAYDRFLGRENMFRVCPKSDGFSAFTQATVTEGPGQYYVGAAVHHGNAFLTDHHVTCATVWAYTEQKVSEQWQLIAAWSKELSKHAVCSDFVGLGAHYSFAKTRHGAATLGLFTDYAKFKQDEEWATEMTCVVPLTSWLSLQPTLHLITRSKTDAVGLLRMTIAL